jgi:hypothetical protein
VSGAVFSKDEARILTWSHDGTARLWNAATGAQVGPALTGAMSGAVFSKDEARILTWGLERTARVWNVMAGAQIAPPFSHDHVVRGAVFSKDGARILTWSLDRTARVWNVTAGAQIAPPLSHDDEVRGAVFSKDETRILTWSADRTARLWNVTWAMRDASDPGFIADVCREKLVGASLAARMTSSSPTVLSGVRHLDARDTLAAPILRGREGEDVCATGPTTWDTILSLLK